MPDAPPGTPLTAPTPLTPERWRRARAAFDSTVGRPAQERAALLDASCAGDPALRAVVERMLAADAGASLHLGPPLAARAPEEAPEAPEAPEAVRATAAGRRVGPYRLVREVGRGGMGTVYLAERDDVGRRVALKLVRGGLAAPERVARFLVERRVLARLDHPLVARLLDAGVADDDTPEAGTPWFAMEYVEGEPLDRYCDARRLGVADRVRLMERACEAVAYAHRHLVVHRDLKPSNLLVTAAGEVRLLDFGIAKLLADDADDAGGDDGRAGLTDAGVRLLTPEYAAPEQVRGEPVTTATDVYALGVMLHELLTGARPGDAASGEVLGVALGFSAGPHAPRPVTRPSAALGRARAATVARVAEARGTTPERLRRRLAGDLDTIVLKALDPDPERRYASAAELLDDLRRHRTGFPVRARPDTPAYRVRAFVRRNRWGVAAAAGLVALLAGTAVVTTVQQARTARAQARTAAALTRATAEAAKARAVTRFVTTLLEDADPYAAGRADARDRIGAERLDRELAGQPEVRVELLRTLAIVQRNLGHLAEAEALHRRRLAELRRLPAAARPDDVLGGALHDYGALLRARSDYVGADTLLRQALAIRERLPGAGGADLAATRIELAGLRRNQGRFAEGERVLRPALATLATAGGAPYADALDQLVHILGGQRRFDGAAAAAREAIALRQRLVGPDHPAVAAAYGRLGTILEFQGRAAEAERAVRHALAIQRAQLPPGHRETLATQSQLAWLLLADGRLAEAERIERAVLDARRRLPGDAARDVAGTEYTLGHILHLRGALPEAARLLRASVATATPLVGAWHPEVVAARQELADVEAAVARAGAGGTPGTPSPRRP